MRCPYCGADNDKVIDTRSALGDMVIRRRRRCLACGRRFNTEERSLERSGPRVIKRDSRTEAFDPDKIRRSIQLACAKRGLDDIQIDALTERVVSELRGEMASEIRSFSIGDIVAKLLAEIDYVAHVRFVSVFRRFESAEDFRRLLEDNGRPTLD
jgi:transcriptional repressor NrdR